MIPKCQNVAADAQFALLARLADDTAGRIDQLNGGVRDRTADDGEAHPERVPQVAAGGSDHCRFSRAVMVEDRNWEVDGRIQAKPVTPGRQELQRGRYAVQGEELLCQGSTEEAVLDGAGLQVVGDGGYVGRVEVAPGNTSVAPFARVDHTSHTDASKPRPATAPTRTPGLVP